MNTLLGDSNRLNLVASSWNLATQSVLSCVMRFSRHFSHWNAVGDDLQYGIENTALDFVVS